MRVLLIGDSCTDIFVYGDCDRICPEAPVPVFIPIRTTETPGMILNVYNNLVSLCDWKIDIITHSDPTIKTRYIDNKSNQMIMRMDEQDHVDIKFDITVINFEEYDAVVVSDYDKGFLNTYDLEEIGQMAKVSFIDTKKILNENIIEAYDFIKINKMEWELCKKAFITYEDVSDKLLLTMGNEGAMWDGIIFPVDNTIEVRDVSGAGDTWLAAFVFNYLTHRGVICSVKFANYCSTKVVQKRGVSVI